MVDSIRCQMDLTFWHLHFFCRRNIYCCTPSRISGVGTPSCSVIHSSPKGTTEWARLGPSALNTVATPSPWCQVRLRFAWLSVDQMFSTRFLIKGNERESLEQGGKIILPPSALDQLTRLNIVYPMLFKLTNASVSVHNCSIICRQH